jgi:hypothetical protein
MVNWRRLKLNKHNKIKKLIYCLLVKEWWNLYIVIRNELSMAKYIKLIIINKQVTNIKNSKNIYLIKLGINIKS